MPLLRTVPLLSLVSLAATQVTGQSLLRVTSPGGQILFSPSGLAVLSCSVGIRGKRPADAPDAARNATHTTFSKQPVNRGTVLDIHMVSGGGNAMWIHPAKP